MSSISKVLLQLKASALIYVLSFFTLSVLVGGSQMFSRQVTLDSVRGIDFKLVASSIADRTLANEGDQSAILETLNSLVLSSGYTLFPLALLDRNRCVSNAPAMQLCQFWTRQNIPQLVNNSASERKYGIDSIKTNNGDVYLVKRLSGDSRWVIGKAGKYTHHAGWPPKEWVFLKEDAAIFFSTQNGFKKMAEKCLWSWCAIFVILIFLAIARAVNAVRHENIFDNITDESEKALQKLIEAEDEVCKLRDYANHADIRGNDLEKKLADAKSELELREIEVSKLEAAKLEAAKQISKPKALQHSQQVEDAYSDLQRLWRSNTSWSDRLKIEPKIAKAEFSELPFTAFIALLQMEFYLKYECSKSDIPECENNQERTIRLHDKGRINKANMNLLLDAHKARNKWFHERKPMNQELVTRLVRFLEQRKNPKISPRI